MENMEKTMAEMEIDINKMPLGRLSEATIKRGVRACLACPCLQTAFSSN